MDSTSNSTSSIFNPDIDLSAKNLSIADIGFGDPGCKSLMRAMMTAETCGVVSLDLRGNAITAEGGDFIGEMLNCSLNTHQPVQFLNLEWNRLGVGSPGGFPYGLSEALKGNTTLRVLDLRNNSIGTNGAQSVAVFLEFNQALERLDLRWNSIGSAGAKCIMNSLKLNESGSLTKLLLQGNGVSDGLLDEISSLLEGNRVRTRIEDEEKLHFLPEEIMQSDIRNADTAQTAFETLDMEFDAQLLRMKLSDTEEQLKSIQKQLSSETELRKRVEIQCEQSIIEMNKLRSECEKKVKILSDQSKQSEVQVRSLQKRSMTLEQQLNHRKESYELHLQSLQRSLQEEEDQRISLEVTRLNDARRSEDQNGKLRKRQNSEIEKFEEKIKDCVKNVDEKNREISRLKEEYSAVQEKHCRTVQLLTSKQERDRDGQLTELEKRMNFVSSKARSMEMQKLQEKDNRISQLEAECMRWRTKLSYQQRELDDNRKLVRELGGEGLARRASCN
eukprot:969536_1